MSNLAYIALSLLVGVGFGLANILVRRHEPEMTSWNLALVSGVAVLLGFALMAFAGELIVGEQAMPRWIALTKHFWMFALATLYLADPKYRRHTGSRPLGIGFIVLGAFAIALDIHDFTART